MVTKYNVAREATEHIYPTALLGLDFPEGLFTTVYAEEWHFKEQYFGASLLFGNFYSFLRIFYIPPTFCLCLFLDTWKVVPLTIYHIPKLYIYHRVKKCKSFISRSYAARNYCSSCAFWLPCIPFKLTNQ